jgi:hypothetical protein
METEPATPTHPAAGELPVRCGIHTRDWFLNPAVEDAEAPLAQIVWRGANRLARAVGCDIGLFKCTYENPRPEVELESMEFQSTLSPCSPALVAITVE